MHVPFTPRWRALAFVPAVLIALAVSAPAFADSHPTMGSQATLLVGAHTSFDRAYGWTAAKSVDQHSLTLAENQTATVNYTVTVASQATDSNWLVQDGIVIRSSSPFTIDALSDVTASATQGSTTTAGTVQYCATDSLYQNKVGFPFTGTSLLCHYTVPLPDGTDGTVATGVTFDDGSSASTSTAFDFSSGGNLESGQPVVTNDAVDVVDSQAGTLGQLTAPVDGQTYTYSRTIGPYSTCGDSTIDNTVTVTASGGSTALAQAAASVAVHVTCPPPPPPPNHGCGSWKDCDHGGGGCSSGHDCDHNGGGGCSSGHDCDHNGGGGCSSGHDCDHNGGGCDRGKDCGSGGKGGSCGGDRGHDDDHGGGKNCGDGGHGGGGSHGGSGHGGGGSHGGGSHGGGGGCH